MVEFLVPISFDDLELVHDNAVSSDDCDSLDSINSVIRWN